MYIRKAQPQDDFLAISRLYAQSWQSAYRGILPQKYLDTLDEGRWTEYLSLDQHNLLLAVSDTSFFSTSVRYLGACSYSIAREKEMTGWGEVVSLYLLPSYFRQGIGCLLLTRALQELSAQGFSKIYLWVLSANLSARRFYEKQGFSWNGTRRIDYIGGKQVEELRYCKTLKKKPLV